MEVETRKTRLLAVSLAVALLALAAGRWLFPRFIRHGGETLPVIHCDLGAHPCQVNLPDGGGMRVEISPRPIPALAPLEIRVALTGAAIKTVGGIQLDFSGVDMEMGFNRVRLEKTAEGQFAGKGNLPVCFSGRMRWQATFLLASRHGPLAVPFQFESGR